MQLCTKTKEIKILCDDLKLSLSDILLPLFEIHSTVYAFLKNLLTQQYVKLLYAGVAQSVER